MSVRDLVTALWAGADCVELSVRLDEKTPVSPVHVPFRMALGARHGDWVREGGLTGATEMIVMSGHTGTHIDALCHVARHGRLFGDVDAPSAMSGGKFGVLGIETVGPIVRRGVVVDVPRLRGVDVLRAGEAVTGSDVEACLSRAGLEVEPGDVVLIRTGWPQVLTDGIEKFVGWTEGAPGIDESAGRWLGESGAFLVGGDTLACEQVRPGLGHSRLPVHGQLLVDYGVHIVEMLFLEELCARHVLEFIFLALPLPVVGATGSPIRAVALVYDDRTSTGELGISVS